MNQPTSLTPAQLVKAFQGHSCKRAGCTTETLPDGSVKTTHKIGKQLYSLVAGPQTMSKEEAQKVLGQRMQKAREQRKLSVKQVSERVGLPYGAIYKIEKGRTGLSLPILLKYARAVNLSLDELFDGVSLPPLTRARKTQPRKATRRG